MRLPTAAIEDGGAAEHPPDEVDVVNAAVEEDAAGSRREADEEAVRVDGVFGDATNGEHLAELACIDKAFGLGVGGIEPPHEADHHDLSGTSGRFRDGAVAIGGIERQRFLAEHMLAGPDAVDHLVGVQRGRRHQPHGVEIAMSEQLRQARIGRDAA